MKRAVLILVVVLCLPVLGVASEFSSSTVDVVAWDFKGFNPIDPDQQAELVRLLADLDAEVVAVVEVNPNNVAHDEATELTELGGLL